MEIKSEVSKETLVKIAKACHMVNKSYCESLGDFSQVSWEDADTEIQNSAIVGVMHHLINKDVTPEESHEVWMEFKAKEGWTYGETKDSVSKTHPCMVPYEQLAQAHRSKDYIFKAVVETMVETLGV